jgi:hypothetical protein
VGALVVVVVFVLVAGAGYTFFKAVAYRVAA